MFNTFKISEDNRQNLKQLRNARVAVLGAARSGIAAAKLIHKSGAKVILSDIKPANSLHKEIESLPTDIYVELGMHSRKILCCDLVCISPGIPLSEPFIKEVQGEQIPIVGELELASWFTEAPIIAITGSNGKTTTTTLTGNIFKRYFQRIVVGGNIGYPFSAQLLEQPDPEICILEVSSFQLETIKNFRPKIAVIMNLSPNHLDRYADYDAYIQAKMNILKNLNENDIVIYNADDSLLSERIAPTLAKKIPFSNSQPLKYGAYWDNNFIHINLDHQYSIEVQRYAIRGPHNHYNMVVAALLAALHEIPADIIKNELEDFSGLPHRLEEVVIHAGITFVNDSKATTVSSLNYALQSFERPIVLIAGGIDKGGDFSELDELLKKQVRAAILIGKASDRMAEAWESIIPIHKVHALEDAVYTAMELAEKGDIVLLSPACSSFDMFKDYEDRGNQFKNIVRNLAASENSKVKMSSL